MFEEKSLGENANTCRAKKADGSPCKNRILAAEKFCYHHSNGLWNKIRYLHRNKKAAFWTGIGIAVVFGVLGAHPALTVIERTEVQTTGPAAQPPQSQPP